jgi:hypothetical protein
VASLYHVDDDDTIVNTAGGARNLGERTVVGLDYHLQAILHPADMRELRLWAYASFLLDEEESVDGGGDTVPIGDLAHEQVIGGASMMLGDALSASLRGRYISGRRTVATNPLGRLPSFATFDAAMSWQALRGVTVALKVTTFRRAPVLTRVRQADAGVEPGFSTARVSGSSAGYYSHASARRAALLSLRLTCDDDAEAAHLRPEMWEPACLYRRAAITAALLVGLAAGMATSDSTLDPVPEYELKAELVSRFPLFVEWPEWAFASPSAPFVVCVFGDNPFDGSLSRRLAAEPIQGRVAEERGLAATDDVTGCHLLFISATASPQLEHLLAITRGRPVLTVGDTAGFAERGVHINLFVVSTGSLRGERAGDPLQRFRLGARLPAGRLVDGGSTGAPPGPGRQAGRDRGLVVVCTVKSLPSRCHPGRVIRPDMVERTVVVAKLSSRARGHLPEDPRRPPRLHHPPACQPSSTPACATPTEPCSPRTGRERPGRTRATRRR